MYEHNREYPALPRHLIETGFQQNSADAFLGWSFEVHTNGALPRIWLSIDAPRDSIAVYAEVSPLTSV